MIGGNVSDSTVVVGLGPYLVLLIPITAAAIVSIINAFQTKGVKPEIQAVKQELKTFNESTLGQLGEANEARRIAKIPLGDRTPKEKRHMGMTDTDTADRTQSTTIPQPKIPTDQAD